MAYDGCTWEDEKLISDIAQPEIDKYWDRTRSAQKKSDPPRYRRDWKPIKTQPSYIKGGELRDFQLKGLSFIAFNWSKGNSCILADEMGLGKTVQTVAFMSYVGAPDSVRR